MESKLMPCKRCGSYEYCICKTPLGGVWLFFVRCETCGNIGDTDFTEEGAIELWQKR